MARERPGPAARRRDLVRVGAPACAPGRCAPFLSALGIAIGIAAMIAVVGISASSRAELDRQLAALGTNLLTVGAGRHDVRRGRRRCPTEAVAMIGRIGPVHPVAATGTVADAQGLPHRPDPGGADRRHRGAGGAHRTCSSTVGATVASGTWLNAATARYPAVVLGSAAAERLGIGDGRADHRCCLGGQWFTVVGILDPVPLAPELDSAALVGWPAAARRTWASTGTRRPSTRDRRTRRSRRCGRVLAATANPRAPERGQGVPAVGRAGRPAGHRTRRSPGCCSGSARWRCWSAASAWPTRW